MTNVSHLWFVLALALSACGHAPSPRVTTRVPSLTYDISINAAMSRIDVRMCTTEARCSEYHVNTEERTGSLTQDPMRMGRTLVIPTGRFLRAPQVRVPFPYRVRFAKPAGMDVSVPWLADDDGYLLEARDFRFGGFAVFGRFELLEVEVGGTTLNVALPESASRMDEELLRTWLTSATETVGKLTGAFPVPRAQIVIAAIPSSTNSVPFGMAFRGGGASVILVVSQSATAQALGEDWVAIHELTHLTLPFIRENDAWFSEGYATYFQEALRLYAGRRSEADVRAALADAFERASNAGSGRTLADETRQRHTTHAYQRIYWGGAAIMMLADAAYHEAPHACGSLREAVRRAAFSQDDMARIFSADEVIARLDTACGAPALATLRDRWLSSSEFPVVNAQDAAALH